MIARMPVRSASSSSDRSKPRRLTISSWLRMRSLVTPNSSRGASSAWAMAAADSSDMGGCDRSGPPLVDQHLPDGRGFDLGRGYHEVHPPQDLHAELVGALAAGK